MNLACTLASHLPLPASAFVNFDLGRTLSDATSSHEPLVVAEKVLRVPDSNRPPHCRVDFFCYMPTGEVVRYHPYSMQPHSMPPGCNLFDAGLARSVGVGAALHLQPPRLVAYSSATQPGDLQPGELLVTRQDMTALCTYDINKLN